jgi:sialic acid synthase SpsE
LHPKYLPEVLGKKAISDLEKGTALTLGHFKQ